MISVAVRAKLANPFPGLRPFREGEEHLFFGRESQIDTMVDKLAVSRFLAVVGTSGSGKSSLVNCGLKPALRRGLMARAGTHWRVAQFRPGGGPIKSLARALAAQGVLFDNPDFDGLPAHEMIEATLAMSKLGLVDMYEQTLAGAGSNLLIVVDQFEEVFRFKSLQSSPSDGSVREERAAALVNLLLEAAQSEHPIYVVLTMRSDFLGDCAQFEGLPEAINRGEYLVPRMSRDERKSAITGPVRVADGDISPVLLTRLLNDVGDNPDQLPILQHALNRTWARWQSVGDSGCMSLEHYEAIGTMAHALDQHAEKAFAELPDENGQTICKKIFQSLTDKGSDARGVRRPTGFSKLCAIAEASPEQVTAVIDVFRKPSRSFLMPPAGEELEADTVIDISHESLMRVWTRLRGWVEEEAESAARYLRLVENANLHAKGASGLMSDPELALMLDWQERWRPNAVWAKRYHPDFDGAMAFLQGSRIARDAILLSEEHARKQELKRARAVAVVFAIGFIVAVGLAVYAFLQRSAAQAERQLRAQQQALNAAQAQLIETEKKAKAQSDALNAQLQDALAKTEEARKVAEAADARAEAEAERTRRNAELFMSAMQAQAAAQRAAAAELEQAAILQIDTDSKKDAATLQHDKLALEEAKKVSQQLATAAAQKAGEAFAVMGAVKIIGTNQISHSDLFDSASGVQVTGDSGAKNPADMFSGAHGSPARATIFADGQPVGHAHWVQWRTLTRTTIRSVGLFAAHDQVRFRRAFSNFKLFAKEQGNWVQIAEYTPALPYGGNCSQQPCLAPDINYKPGSVLSVCVNVSKPVQAQEYRAEFAQAVSKLEGFSGPRVLQLDGYTKANCTK